VKPPVADMQKLAMLGVRLTVATQSMKILLKDLDRLDGDTKSPPNQRLEEIKKIRAELSKVGTEIDSIKEEITLLKQYRVN
jgi:hypothetical protein